MILVETDRKEFHNHNLKIWMYQEEAALNPNLVAIMQLGIPVTFSLQYWSVTLVLSNDWLLRNQALTVIRHATFLHE